MSHPIHPAVAHFPIALWCSAIGVDLVACAGWFPLLPGLAAPTLGHALLAAGLLLAPVTMAAGAFDLWRRRGSVAPVSGPVDRHIGAMSTASTLILIATLMRGDSDGFDFGAAPTGLDLCVELTALVFLIAGGRAAASMVYGAQGNERTKKKGPTIAGPKNR